MIGPSGFFQNINDSGIPVSSADLEIVHDSEDGFNILYKAIKNGRFFVYKALKPEYRGNPLYEELLRKDFNIGFSLTHNNICQYYGMVDLPDVGRCIVMEWIDGCSLEELISKGGIDKSLAKKIICELCDALEYMHKKQVLHRDLKPENILITYNGQNVKLIDFGLSDADSYNAFKIPAGTKIYASPELLSGEHIDCRSDIWSLGMIMSEMTGYYSHVVSRCLCRNRERRFKTMTEVKSSVLKTGRRKTFIYIISLIVTLLVASGIWCLVRNVAVSVREPKMPLPVQSEESLPILEEQIDIPVKEKETESRHGHIQEPVRTEENMDSMSLDEMFKEASERL